VNNPEVDIEERLTSSLYALAAEVPDRPPIRWSAFVATPAAPRHRWRTALAVAASMVLIALGTVLWASPSAGARDHGRESLRTAPFGLVQSNPPRFTS
jgi:hypothetical protein